MPHDTYHISNLSAPGVRLFPDASDYRNFALLLRDSMIREPVLLHGWCLLPDRIHLVAGQAAPGVVARWMRWLLVTHAKRHHARHGSFGPLWRGRARTLPVQHGPLLVTLLRHLHDLPASQGACAPGAPWRWVQSGVDAGHPPSCPAQGRFLEHCLAHGVPIGETDWIAGEADRQGWTPPRPRGRPAGDGQARGPSWRVMGRRDVGALRSGSAGRTSP